MFKNKNVAILGLGKSGLSSYNFFKNQNYQVVAWDDKAEVRDSFALKGFNIKKITDWDLKNLDAIIVSPGISLYYPQHELIKLLSENNINIPLICDIEVFLYFAKLYNKNFKYIAITGTNGKSTTVSLLNFVLKEAGFSTILAGNIGNPILNYDNILYNNDVSKDTFIILELSSYQLDLIYSQNFLVAGVLNIKPDHLDHHGSFENYVNAKLNIFKNQSTGDLAIYSSQCKDFVKNNLTAVKKIEVSDNFNIINQNELEYLKGLHNHQNINFVYFICTFLGLSSNIIIEKIKQFKGLPHRQEFIKQINNVVFINDSKATNLDSTKVALDAFLSQNIYLILGGIQKEDSLDEILPQLKLVNYIFLIGASTNIFAEILKNNNINFTIAVSLQNATDLAFNMANKNNEKSTVLLSPACASFDMFKNFEDRGEQFKNIVLSLS